MNPNLHADEPEPTCRSNGTKGHKNHLFCHSGEGRNPGFTDEEQMKDETQMKGA
ncbi:hypothetical protein JXL19_04625 [bacterium]|nr:hypothetical protein [bacterium]